jgi:fatty-acyl-CoA synthase
MAALVVAEDIDLDGLCRHVIERLPSYARPVFLRLTAAIEATSTFKQRKIELARQGFDLAEAGADPIYFLHPELQSYVRLDPALHDAIYEGKVRL